jgi:hypothetical protein
MDVEHPYVAKANALNFTIWRPLRDWLMSVEYDPRIIAYKVHYSKTRLIIEFNTPPLDGNYYMYIIRRGLRHAAIQYGPEEDFDVNRCTVTPMPGNNQGLIVDFETNRVAILAKKAISALCLTSGIELVHSPTKTIPSRNAIDDAIARWSPKCRDFLFSIAFNWERPYRWGFNAHYNESVAVWRLVDSIVGKGRLFKVYADPTPSRRLLLAFNTHIDAAIAWTYLNNASLDNMHFRCELE